MILKPYASMMSTFDSKTRCTRRYGSKGMFDLDKLSARREDGKGVAGKGMSLGRNST